MRHNSCGRTPAWIYLSGRALGHTAVKRLFVRSTELIDRFKMLDNDMSLRKTWEFVVLRIALIEGNLGRHDTTNRYCD